jgi:hypothetical protein
MKGNNFSGPAAAAPMMQQQQQQQPMNAAPAMWGAPAMAPASNWASNPFMGQPQSGMVS